MEEDLLESSIPRSKCLRLYPISNPNESFYLEIVAGLYGNEIESQFQPVAGKTWLKILRKYLKEK